MSQFETVDKTLLWIVDNRIDSRIERIHYKSIVTNKISNTVWNIYQFEKNCAI